jgi:hypothetical protein
LVDDAPFRELVQAQLIALRCTKIPSDLLSCSAVRCRRID